MTLEERFGANLAVGFSAHTPQAAAFCFGAPHDVTRQVLRPRDRAGDVNGFTAVEQLDRGYELGFTSDGRQ